VVREGCGGSAGGLGTSSGWAGPAVESELLWSLVFVLGECVGKEEGLSDLVRARSGRRFSVT